MNTWLTGTRRPWSVWLGRWRAVRARWPRATLGLAATGGFGAVFVLRTDPGELVESLRGVALPLLLPAIALNFVDVWCQAVRLHALLRHVSPPPPSRLFAALLVGIMGNNVLPLRMGIVLRAQYLSSRYGVHLGSLLSVVVLEGFMDGLVLAALFLPLLLIVGTDAGVFWAVLVSGAVAAGGLIAFRLAWTPRWVEGLRPLLGLPTRIRLPEAVRRPFASWAASFAQGLASVRSGRSLLAAGLATGAAWLVTAGVYYAVGLAFDFDVDWTAYLALTAAINVSGVVQTSGGNLGPYEFVAAEVIAGFGVARGPAGAYAIVTHLVRLIPLTIVGLAIFAWHTILAPPSARTN